MQGSNMCNIYCNTAALLQVHSHTLRPELRRKFSAVILGTILALDTNIALTGQEYAMRYAFAAIISCTITLALPTTGALANPNTTSWEEGVGTFTQLGTVEGSSVDQVAMELASAIVRYDDTLLGMEGDWKLAGYTGKGSPMHAVLKVPGGHRVFALSNAHYTAHALAYGPDKTLAIPFKLAVVENEGIVKIILLNPEAVFALFFKERSKGLHSMERLTRSVHEDLENLIDLSLTGFRGYTPDSVPLGHVMTATEMQAFTARSYAKELNFSIPLDHVTERETFRREVIEAILTHATHEAAPTVGSPVRGLSVSDWRAARSTPLTMKDNTTIIEMCSPTYAKAALRTGIWHAPALPCKIAVYLEKDQLTISVLDTDFMFPTFFGDTPAKMGARLSGMSQAVRADLILIVETAVASLAHPAP